MEEESKYYTPTIEEFRVGFSYEYKNHTGTVRDLTSLPWIKSTIKSINELAYVERGLSIEGNTRVKLLDREDIEEVEFKEREFRNTYKKVVQNKEIVICPYWHMLKLERENLVRIYIEGNEVFRGDIKNKSELQQILKMVL